MSPDPRIAAVVLDLVAVKSMEEERGAHALVEVLRGRGETARARRRPRASRRDSRAAASSRTERSRIARIGVR